MTLDAAPSERPAYEFLNSPAGVAMLGFNSWASEHRTLINVSAGIATTLAVAGIGAATGGAGGVAAGSLLEGDGVTGSAATIGTGIAVGASADAGASVGAQLLTSRSVNWTEVMQSGAVGALSGGVFSGAGTALSAIRAGVPATDATVLIVEGAGPKIASLTDRYGAGIENDVLSNGNQIRR